MVEIGTGIGVRVMQQNVGQAQEAEAEMVAAQQQTPEEVVADTRQQPRDPPPPTNAQVAAFAKLEAQEAATQKASVANQSVSYADKPVTLETINQALADLDGILATGDAQQIKDVFEFLAKGRDKALEDWQVFEKLRDALLNKLFPTLEELAKSEDPKKSRLAFESINSLFSGFGLSFSDYLGFELQDAARKLVKSSLPQIVKYGQSDPNASGSVAVFLLGVCVYGFDDDGHRVVNQDVVAALGELAKAAPALADFIKQVLPPTA